MVQIRCVMLEALWVRNINLWMLCLAVEYIRIIQGEEEGVREYLGLKKKKRKKIDFLAHPDMLSASGSWGLGTQGSVFLCWSSQGLGAWGLSLGPLEMSVLCLGLWAQL